MSSPRSIHVDDDECKIRSVAKHNLSVLEVDGSPVGHEWMDFPTGARLELRTATQVVSREPVLCQRVPIDYVGWRRVSITLPGSMAGPGRFRGKVNKQIFELLFSYPTLAMSERRDWLYMPIISPSLRWALTCFCGVESLASNSALGPTAQGVDHTAQTIATQPFHSFDLLFPHVLVVLSCIL